MSASSRDSEPREWSNAAATRSAVRGAKASAEAVSPWPDAETCAPRAPPIARRASRSAYVFFTKERTLWQQSFAKSWAAASCATMPTGWGGKNICTRKRANERASGLETITACACTRELRPGDAAWVPLNGKGPAKSEHLAHEGLCLSYGERVEARAGNDAHARQLEL
eukprot:scaffold62723_cov32-Tisochrysis_lutea.AAC.2